MWLSLKYPYPKNDAAMLADGRPQASTPPCPGKLGEISDVSVLGMSYSTPYNTVHFV